MQLAVQIGECVNLLRECRCVEDGFCSKEQADLIQTHLEKRLQKLYKIDEILGESLSKSSPTDEHIDEDEPAEKPLTITNDDNSNDHRMNTNAPTESKPVAPETSTVSKTAASKSEPTATEESGALNLTNQISPPSPRSNLSPGEVKPVSPSSLSDASPISN